MSCPQTVHEQVCVGAKVTITPHVTSGDARTFCMGDPFIGTCPGTPGTCGTPPVPCCTFNVSQNLCVQIPLFFDATAVAEPSGIMCTQGATGPCNAPGACTYTIGFWKNHETERNALIDKAGGTIILGIGTQGLSLTVDKTNAFAVLNEDAPSPPTPPNPPHQNQYQQLYAQLLGARLNILNGATCEAADTAIANANTFIAGSSVPNGDDGAPDKKTPLAAFNEGTLDECPTHCPDDDNGDNGGNG